MQLRALLLTALCFFSWSLQAQSPTYPKNYFRNPLGIPMDLAANFGELRPDHWHMGLDIRTAQKENLPVYAAADGYIAHIGIRPQSFGRFIIINHPNGLSTLYAHLNDFVPAVEEFVRKQEYEQESWAIELDFSKDKFPVYKNQLIAYSGNTGGSQGAHLHFEIIDTKTTKRFNPLLFGFPMKDNVPPSLVRLAMYDRSKSVYEQNPIFFSLKNTDSGYIIPKLPVMKTGLNKVSFAIQAFDRMNGSGNQDGIYSAKLFLDDQPQVSFVLDSIDYDETAYVNAQIDYKYHFNGGSFLQHLSELPGDNGIVYKKINGDGVITLSDTGRHTVRIEVKDAYFNTSQLGFTIQYDSSLVKKDISKNENTYFLPNTANTLKKQDFEMLLPKGSLYDAIPSFYFLNNSLSTYAVSGLHKVNDPSYPLHDAVDVRIKPVKPIPTDWRDKLVIQRTAAKGNSVRKAEWQGDTSPNAQWLAAKFGDFGSFQAFADIIPPQINDPDSYREGKGDTVNLSSATKIVFQPTDNFGVIKKFRAELNRQWLRFTNDKSKNWIYVFDERCPYGVHELKVTIEDLVGNKTEKSWWFKRSPYTPPPPKKKGGKKGSSKKEKEAGNKKKPTKKKK
jgi:hypothetical protein